jgi:ABC-2 type transport system ATP-binding protein
VVKGLLQKYRNPAKIDYPALSVIRAAHSFGASKVLDGVSLDIEQGEIYSLLGPNGAGKSTLLRAISGRLDLDGGKVRIGGRFPPRSAAARGLIGYVPQDIALYQHLTVRENLEFFGRMFGLAGKEAAAAVRKTLARASLEEQAGQITATLSGGYQRRVNIAVAALNMPYLLVLDEPTVGIDVQAREAIHVLLRILQDTGTAILLTTHDLDQAQALSGRVGILQAGVLKLEGEPAQLLQSAFGNSKEMIVDLRRPADRREEAFLRGLDLVPIQSALAWCAEIAPEHFDVAEFSDYLANQGLDVKEVRVRKPDLTSLFLKIVGEQPA